MLSDSLVLVACGLCSQVFVARLSVLVLASSVSLGWCLPAAMVFSSGGVGGSGLGFKFLALIPILLFGSFGAAVVVSGVGFVWRASGFWSS